MLGERAIETEADQRGIARIGRIDLAQQLRGSCRVLARYPPVGLQEIGLERIAEIGRDGALADMIDLRRQLEALGLAEQIAVLPRGVHPDAEDRLVADAKTDGTRQAVFHLDVER